MKLSMADASRMSDDELTAWMQQSMAVARATPYEEYVRDFQRRKRELEAKIGMTYEQMYELARTDVTFRVDDEMHRLFMLMKHYHYLTAGATW